MSERRKKAHQNKKRTTNRGEKKLNKKCFRLTSQFILILTLVFSSSAIVVWLYVWFECCGNRINVRKPPQKSIPCRIISIVWFTAKQKKRVKQLKVGSNFFLQSLKINAFCLFIVTWQTFNFEKLIVVRNGKISI